MTDLNMMMRDQARMGLQSRLDTAVTNGDTEEARKVATDLAKLEVSIAPKAPAYGDAEIRAELDKQPWFGTDPKRSKAAVDFGKTMNPAKFATAELFAKAITDAVEAEFKPPGKTEPEEPGEEDEPTGKAEAGEKKARRTDGPGEGDAGAGAATRRTSGPWTKMSDAPAAIQADIKRAADKFVGSRATKEQRESFVSKMLDNHYQQHLRSKGKK